MDNLLLSDEQILKPIAQELFEIWREAKSAPGDYWENMPFDDLPQKHKGEYYKTAKRILAYCAPLIRAKVAQEILRKIDTAAKNDADICIGTVPAGDCQTCDGYPTCFHLRLQEIKAEYEVKK